jgi:PAS domain S-box-containing protein
VKDPALKTRGIGDPSVGGLSALGPELAETLVAVASDIALVVDLDGTLRCVAIGADSPVPTAGAWVGRRWVDTVTPPTRHKIERLLREVALGAVSRRCEVEHPLPSGAGVPVAYVAVRLGRSGPVLAAGRELKSVAAMQQRFVQAQQQMERDGWRRREAESRYRRLFHGATDAMLVVDGVTHRIVEGNSAAAERLGVRPDALAGRDALAGFDAASRPTVAALCARARDGGRPAEVRARLTGPGGAVDVAATPLRGGEADLMLLRLHGGVADDGSGRCVGVVEGAPSPILEAVGRRSSTHRARAQLLARVGELPLHELLAQAATLAERQCIERALELAGGDRDAAARLLGLGRADLETRLGEAAARAGDQPSRRDASSIRAPSSA